MKLVKFKQYACILDYANYNANEDIQSITLIDTDNGDEVLVATVFHEDLRLGEIGIKNWHENEGVYDSLLAANIINPHHRTISTNLVEILVCRLRGDRKDYMQNSLTWQAHMMMMVSLECLKYRKYPNGDTLTANDVVKLNNEIQQCTEILNEHKCQLPVLEDNEGDQFNLFS